VKAARKLKAPVVVAKLDRLSRDVHFISALMAERVPFIVAELARIMHHARHFCISVERARDGIRLSNASATASSDARM
jgi:hypothetical protein